MGGAVASLPPEQGSDCWAPEVVQAEGRWWMYYSVGFEDRGHSLRVATAGSPLGPVADCGLDLTLEELLRSTRTRSRTPRAGGTCSTRVLRARRAGPRAGGDTPGVAELAQMTALAGPGGARTPGGLADLRAAAVPARTGQRLAQPRGAGRAAPPGPVLPAAPGGSDLPEGHGVAWARADHPLGPCTEPDRGAGERLLASVPGHVRRPGTSVVTTPAGQDVLVHHDRDKTMTRRCRCIDPLLWGDGGPYTPRAHLDGAASAALSVTGTVPPGRPPQPATGPRHRPQGSPDASRTDARCRG